MIHPLHLHLFKPVFTSSLSSRRDEKSCCALATYKDGGNGYAKTYRQNGVLPSPTLGRDSRDYVPTDALVWHVASADDVPVVKSRPPASAGGLATFSPFRSLVMHCATTSIAKLGNNLHHFGSRCLGSPIGAWHQSQIVSVLGNQRLRADLWQVKI